MSLCVAFVATDGLVCVSDGKTTFPAASIGLEPPSALTATRKLAAAPDHLPYCLMFVNRASYAGTEVSLIADALLQEAGDEWAKCSSLKALAHRLHEQFARLELQHPVEDGWTDEGIPVRSKFLGLLCGYPDEPGSVPEFWTIDVTDDAPRRTMSAFNAIGMLGGEAERYLNEIGGHSRWYTSPMRERFGPYESVCEMTAVAAVEAAVTGLQLAELHEKSPGLGPFIGGTWRSLVIHPGRAEDPRVHQTCL